ncbi:anticodon-binding domain-containing protein [Halovulum sp. GXIMD14793]
MNLSISLVLETEDERKALRVVSRLNKIIDASTPDLEAYHKGGTQAYLHKTLPESQWPEAFLAGVLVAQSFGYGWTLLGDAEEELDLVGNEFKISGIEWAQLYLKR